MHVCQWIGQWVADGFVLVVLRFSLFLNLETAVSSLDVNSDIFTILNRNHRARTFMWNEQNFVYWLYEILIFR